MRAGFTLVEMLVVLAIIGIAAAVLPVALLSEHEPDALAAAESYARVLRRARLGAVRTGAPQFVILRESGAYHTTTADRIPIDSGIVAGCDEIAAPALHAMYPSGLIMGDTVDFICGGSAAQLTVWPLQGIVDVR